MRRTHLSMLRRPRPSLRAISPMEAPPSNRALISSKSCCRAARRPRRIKRVCLATSGHNRTAPVAAPSPDHRQDWRETSAPRSGQAAAQRFRGSSAADEKTISDLPRLRRALTCGLRVEARTIAADRFHVRVILEPTRRGRRRTIRQHVHHLTTLQINDDRSGVGALPPRPVIDASHIHGGRGAAFRRSHGAPLQAGQNRRVADRHPEPSHQPLRGPSARAMAEQPNDFRKAGGSAGERRCKTRHALGEDALMTFKPAAGNHGTDVFIPLAAANGRKAPDSHRVTGGAPPPGLHQKSIRPFKCENLSGGFRGSLFVRALGALRVAQKAPASGIVARRGAETRKRGSGSGAMPRPELGPKATPTI